MNRDELLGLLDLSGKDRPREFKTKSGSNAILLVFKREKR